jgi:hypothetical protein
LRNRALASIQQWPLQDRDCCGSESDQATGFISVGRALPCNPCPSRISVTSATNGLRTLPFMSPVQPQAQPSPLPVGTDQLRRYLALAQHGSPRGTVTLVGGQSPPPGPRRAPRRQTPAQAVPVPHETASSST